MIFGAFERMVAMRYLRARRQEGFISVIAGFSLLGIGLGVATLIIVMAVMNGFRAELLGRILGLNGHLGVYGYANQLSNFDPLAEAVRSIPGVVHVSPTVEGQVMVTGRNHAQGAMVRGIRAKDLMSRKVVADNFNGSIDAFERGEGVVIGSRMSVKLGLGVGDTLTMIAPKGQITAFGTVPRMRSYQIVGLFNVGMYEYDSSYVFVPLEEAQVFFQLKDKEAVTHLEVVLENPDLVPRVRSEIAQKVGDAGSVYDWQQANSSFFNAVQVERNVMFLILTLIILVAAFNIISSLIMLVKDKGRDIAILRTMGATQGMIQRIFLLSGASIGVTGTLLGVCLGLAFSLNIESIRQFLQSLTGTDLFSAEIYFLSKLPARVDSGEVIQVVLMALGLSFAATIYPSWRAARLDPVEALRYE
ncbi:MAG: lipoprotein-releasing ABC transporter permease subunit [Alphaproteobacteria bacterium]|nr:lipoprotein-releasing ABC transporter permease subunit [Alphaproteobacteria bacterium]